MTNRGRSGYSRHGKRSLPEAEIPSEAIELMLRAAEMDEDQCVRRFICEISANTVDWRDKEVSEENLTPIHSDRLGPRWREILTCGQRGIHETYSPLSRQAL